MRKSKALALRFALQNLARGVRMRPRGETFEVRTRRVTGGSSIAELRARFEQPAERGLGERSRGLLTEVGFEPRRRSRLVAGPRVEPPEVEGGLSGGRASGEA